MLGIHRGGRDGLDVVAVAGVPAQTIWDDSTDVVDGVGDQGRLALGRRVHRNRHELAVRGHETDHVADHVVLLHVERVEGVENASEAGVKKCHVQILGGLERDDLAVTVNLHALGGSQDDGGLLVDDAHREVMDLGIRLDRAPVEVVATLQLVELQVGTDSFGADEGGQLDTTVLETDKLNLGGGNAVDPGDLGHVAGVEVHQVVGAIQALVDREEPVARVLGDGIDREAVPVDGLEDVTDEIRGDLADDGEAGNIAQARVAEAVEADHAGGLHLDHRRDLVLRNERDARGVGLGVLDVDAGETTKRGLGKGVQNGVELVDGVELAVHGVISNRCDF